MLARRSRRILFAATLGINASLAVAQTNGTWGADVGTAGGNWSNAVNWIGGNVAGGGGTALFNTLPTFTTAPINIVQDSATVNVSGLTFDTFITYLLRAPTLGTPNTITLSGAATIDTPRPSINTLSATVFGHQLQMSVGGSSGLTKTGPGTLTLWATNTYTGGTTINGGIVVARQFGDLTFGNAAGAITLNDGTIRVTTGAWTSSRNINLAGNGTIEASTGNSVTWNGPVSGSGDLNKMGSAGLILNASNGYSGATNLLAGTMTLAGNGSSTATSSVVLRNTLTLDNSATNLANRINDAAPVTMYGAGLALTGAGIAASGETLGDSTFSRGTTTVTLTPGPGGTVTLAMGNVNRDMGGTLFARGTNLGKGTGDNVATMTFASPPSLIGGGGAAGSTNISILPWAWGIGVATGTFTTNEVTFVTYDANGIRPLNGGTEHVTSIATAAATDNVRITTSPQVVSSSTTINSLTIPVAGTISGAGPLTITSGGLLNVISGVTISTPLQFGSAQAMILAPASITLSGGISGSGGLSKQGAGVATFSGSSDYAGTTIIGGGTASFVNNVPSGANSPFGNSTSAIVLAPAGLGTGGTTARLVYAGSSAASVDRDLQVSGRIALNNAATLPGFGLSTAQTLTMNGNITLDQSPLTFIGAANSALVINGNITGTGGPVTDQGSAATSTITLNGTNTFDGGVEMNNSIWAIGSDSALGNGSGLIKTVQTSGSPTIMSVGGAHTIANPAVSFSFSTTYWTIGGANDITFTGSINLSGSYTHNISNTGLTTYAGVLHTGGFTKSGSGTLVLSGSNIYTGTTTITSGVLRVANSSALGTPQAPTVVASGAALEVTGNSLTSEPLTFGGTGVGGAGAIRNLSGTNSLGDATLSASATIAVDTGKLTVGNVVTAPVAGFVLTKNGPGTLEARRYRPGGFVVSSAVATTTNGRSTDKTSTVGGGNLTISPGATLDIGENDWVVDYGIVGPSPFATLAAQVAQGYNATGDWQGTGINSRFAAATASSAHKTAVGIAEASDIFTSFPATFSGQNVDSSAVLIRYTYSGDANLDGSVDTVDFNLLASNFSNTGARWSQGDFNYDGMVDTTDFDLLASNFSLTLAGSATNLGALVPEPSGLLSIVSVMGLAARKRRRNPRN